MNPSRLIFVICGIFVALAVGAGCSLESYRQWADAVVKKLLDDRKEKALGYQPATPPDAPIPKTPTPKKAWAEIPETPLPPPQPPAVEPQRVDVTYGPLGPETKWMRDWPEPANGADVGIAGTQQQALNRFRAGPPSPFIQISKLDLFNSLALRHSA